VRKIKRSALLLVCLAACADPSIDIDAAIECDSCEKWNKAQEAFQIFGNTYFVGVAGLSSILIDSGDGLILLDGGLPQSVPLIVDNIESLGFSIDEIKVIGLSHAHFDHAGGIAALQRASGARVVARATAAVTLRNGNLLPDDPQYGATGSKFPAVESVETVSDHYVIQVDGLGVQLIATPGHTLGGTSFSWESCEEDDCRRIVYVDSLSAASAGVFRFSSGPTSAADMLRWSTSMVAGLDCDIFLAPHPFNFHMQQKLRNDFLRNPFIDSGCEDYASYALEGLEERLLQEMRR